MRRRRSAPESRIERRGSTIGGPLIDRCTEHRDALYWTALRLSRDHDDAQDLVQLTYLKAMRTGCREIASCKAWLFRILTNSFIDHYRRRRRSAAMPLSDKTCAKSVTGEAVDGEGGDAEVGDPSEETDPTWLLSVSLPDEVLRALDNLPRILRELIVLRDLKGYSYRECAESLGIPLGTVMSRLHRGRESLRKRLVPYARARGFLQPARTVADSGGRSA